MDAFFQWLQELPLSTYIAESETIWGYPTVLGLHTLGIALTAGTSWMIDLRLLGLAESMPVTSLKKLLTPFWIGFILNAITGSLLFMAAASARGYQPVYYAKLACILLAVLTMRPIQTLLAGDRGSDEYQVPASARNMALANLLLWGSVITTGRFIAYLR